MKIMIFVEGTTDQRLIRQYCQKLQNDNIIDAKLEIDVQSVDGWTTIDSEKGEVYINILKRNSLGINLLIFDADDDPKSRRQKIHSWRSKYGINFELFLFPNNHDVGTVETLLEDVINPENQCVIKCWHQYEEQLCKQTISWKSPQSPTCPSEKSKIYGYLEALVGTTKSEKEKIKDANRDFTNTNHWNLEADEIQPLKDFLVVNIMRNLNVDRATYTK